MLTMPWTIAETEQGKPTIPVPTECLDIFLGESLHWAEHVLNIIGSQCLTSSVVLHINIKRCPQQNDTRLNVDKY